MNMRALIDDLTAVLSIVHVISFNLLYIRIGLCVEQIKHLLNIANLSVITMDALAA